MKKVLLSAVVMTTLTACASVSLPVTGVTSNGEQWSGYFTIREFTLAGDGVICKGATPTGTQRVQTASFVCDDGRTGTATTNRTSMTGGVGTFQVSDGTVGEFTYGT
jgi:hypothetical protein